MILTSILAAISLLPAPSGEIKTSGDSLKMPDNATLCIELTDTAESRRLKSALQKEFPTVNFKDKCKKPIVRLNLNQSLPAEGYSLDITTKGISIAGGDAAGIFYGIQSLGGLIAKNGKIPCLSVSDSPRFQYRGFMLDVSRNFRDVDFVKKQLDAMARMKLNNLHFHLTDGAGWRIAIDKYPRLTDFAAWRKGATWKDWNREGNLYTEQSDPEASGGFYTKDELREIVRYAADRYINIIPEIEMPSHSEEVLSAYPELSCTHKPYGESDFCPGNDSVYVFLQNVLSEVMDLFPSKLIHIGGDEAPKRAWHDCELCKKRMADEGLSDVNELQSYLIGRIERFLNDNGRDMLGWDEIMEGGLAPNATVMSWRGTEGGEKAAAGGHRVIMTPGRFCYLDGYQDAPATQPEAIGGYLPLELVYSFEPVPASLANTDKEKYIYGLQGNLFTEYIPTAEHAEYMIYPRLMAIAERGWSSHDCRDYNDFKQRVITASARLQKEGYNVFDISTEVGNRPEAAEIDRHLAFEKPVRYLVEAWPNYPANGELTLTDGNHGGWNYNDSRWQGFLKRGTDRMDVVIDLGQEQDVSYIGTDFMQICGPDVWFPANVEFYASLTENGDNPENFTLLGVDTETVERTDDVRFRTFSWTGSIRARYIRVRATADEKFGGILFTDEIVVR